MIIKCDAEGKKVIEQMIDISLKAGGIQNLNGSVGILNQIEIIEPVEEKKED